MKVLSKTLFSLLFFGIIYSGSVNAKPAVNGWKQYTCQGSSESFLEDRLMESNNKASIKIAYNKDLNSVQLLGWNRFTENGIDISQNNNIYGTNKVDITPKYVDAVFRHSSGDLSYNIELNVKKLSTHIIYRKSTTKSVFDGVCKSDQWVKF